jgi:hypothetical protein
MAERRALVEGIKTAAQADPDREQNFVYGSKVRGAGTADNPAPVQKVTKDRPRNNFPICIMIVQSKMRCS